MKIIKLIKSYFSAEARIARKLRQAANIAGDNYYQIAFGELSSLAKKFDEAAERGK